MFFVKTHLRLKRLSKIYIFVDLFVMRAQYGVEPLKYMKTLYIVRHAKSSWSDPSLDDFDRPLNKRGKRNAPDMGRRIANRHIEPDLIMSSPAVRALSTAKIIARAIAYPAEKLLTDRRLYHANVEEALRVIRETDDRCTSLMIFGHNPGLTDLVNHLTGSDIYNVPTCGYAQIESDIDRWSRWGDRVATLAHYDYPKKGDNA